MKNIEVRGLKIGRGIPGIIVPVMEKTAEEVLSFAKKVRSGRADLCEFRLDAYEDYRNKEKVGELLSSLSEVLDPIPLLVTLRTAFEGGLASVTEEDYLEITKEVILTGRADLIDFENALTDPEMIGFAHEHGVLTVLSCHDFQKTPEKEEILFVLTEMAQKGCDIAKCAYMAKDRASVDRLLGASKEASYRLDQPLITISMGEEGLISRTSGEVYGSALTFASAGKASAPGQIDALRLTRILRAIHLFRQLDRPVFLTGFMGTGKSTVAKRLSAFTGQVVCEMDALIEERAGCTINEIFAREGQEGFRRRETELLVEIGRESGVIVSCGGGVVTREENIHILRRSGYVFLLRAGLETLMERLSGETATRPLLQGEDASQRVASLLAEREEAYQKAAHFVIDTDGLSPDEIALAILESFEKADEEE